jgi:hypothetical protein
MTTGPDEEGHVVTDGDPVSVTAELCATVADEHRRAVLRVLPDDALAFDTLAEEVAHQMQPDGGPDHRRHVRISLHHVHLPKLDEAGLIEYDTEQMRVRDVSEGLGHALLEMLDEGADAA